MSMMRYCPICQTERSLQEFFCEGRVADHECGWDLSNEPIREAGWRPALVVTAEAVATVEPLLVAAPLSCINGHPMDEGDLFCMRCGADAWVTLPETTLLEGPSLVLDESPDGVPAVGMATQIDDWGLLSELSVTDGVRVRYLAEHAVDGRRAVLTLYRAGAEPDTAVYEVLKQLPLDYVPEIFATGRWAGQAYVVTEELTGGMLADLSLPLDDMAMIHQVVTELGQALNAFAEVGLRHCDLRPETLLVRSTQPLDLVITGFGSARLSEYDLEIISPLQTTRYMSPETIAGGVSVASDWWSLGVLLLAQLTDGACFEDVNPQAFLIHVLTNGVVIPDTLSPPLQLLLRGLLARDHHQRWQWPQVQAWLQGEPVAAPASAPAEVIDLDGVTISLQGRRFRQAKQFALAAADVDAWAEAKRLLLGGELLTWLAQIGFAEQDMAHLRATSQRPELSDDFKLMLTLKLLNPDMPLVLAGDLVTSGWLLQHPVEGYQLLDGFVPRILKTLDTEPWLWRLQARAQTVRTRADALGIRLDEIVLQIHLLSTSRAQLAVLWQERCQLFPDARHAGLLSLTERPVISEEDLIILLSADLGLFKSLDSVVAEAMQLARQNDVATLEEETVRAQAMIPRLGLYQTLNERIEGFAKTGHDKIDEWADQYRLEKRMPLARLLLLLSIPTEQWLFPQQQQYVAALLDHFQKKVTVSILRGPLVRMQTSQHSTRMDLTLFDSTHQPAAKVLDHILGRATRAIKLDALTLAANPMLESRLNRLNRKAQLYQRDTGINSLYLGFPFLRYQEPDSQRLPRIAPVFLWPIRLHYESGLRSEVSLAFDAGREEVRINPALALLLGKTRYAAWQTVIDELLARSSLNATEVMAAFSLLGDVLQQQLVALDTTAELPKGSLQFACSAVLFDVSFAGQAVGEDLQQLQQRSVVNTGLETALRLNQSTGEDAPIVQPIEAERYFTVASDPSQERAVFQARQAPGLLIEGPPGTGKSQTIVNMVADAIGRGKTLLIVCQKKAALEVVHKRLVAEGMGQRCVMINDVNADRNPIITSVRDQLAQLHGMAANQDWQPERARMAATIERLEGLLDKGHQALHQLDEQSNMTYRQLMGELIALSQTNQPFAAPLLRTSLSPLSQSAVAALADECAPVIRHWLPAHYEDNPLSALRPFAYDPAMLDGFQTVFADFMVAEQRRVQTLAQHPASFDMAQAMPYRLWLNASSQAYLDVSDALRQRLAQWLPLFAHGATHGHSALLTLADLSPQLQAVSTSAWYGHSAALGRLTDAALMALMRRAEVMSVPAPWYGALSLRRFNSRRGLFRFLQQQGVEPIMADLAPLHQALRLEQSLRPIRQSLQALCCSLGCPSPDDGVGTEMGGMMDQLSAQLQEVQGWATQLALTPEPEKIEQALVSGRAAVTLLRADYQAACLRHDVRTAGLQALALLQDYMGADLHQACAQAIGANDITPGQVDAIQQAFPYLAAYQFFRQRASLLSVEALSLLQRLRHYQPELQQVALTGLDHYVRRLIKQEAYLAWTMRLEQASPELLLDHAETTQQIKDLAKADQHMRALNRVLLEQAIPMEALAKRRDWEDVTRLTGARAKRLREFVAQGEGLGLMKLRPIWLMNPDVASRVLPLKAGLFDVVVYDEASQMPIEYALPTLFRGKVAVVSGDEKQMPPSSFFGAQLEVDEEEDQASLEAYDELTEDEQQSLDHEWNRREIMDCPDLLQLARSVLPATTLQIHYRSKYRELINYSNAAFYGGRLNVPVRHPAATIREVKPIELVQVAGVYEDQSNRQEAERVVAMVATLWQQPKAQRPSLGIVTFNKKQADLIADLLDARASEDTVFALAYQEESQRLESGEDMSVFVKNVENVQGDERDVILFSTTFGRNKLGVFRRHFGVLGQKGGERRLNVAITRAREKVVLVTSMPIQDVSDMFDAQRPPATPRDYLQCYLAYAQHLSQGDFGQGTQILQRVVRAKPSRHQAQSLRADDGFVANVEAFIRSLGVTYTKAQGDDAFALDFAIEDPKTHLFVFGIECDAPVHTLLTQARAREIWRPKVLKRAMPEVYRLSSRAWYADGEQVKQQLAQAIANVLADGPEGVSV